MLNTSSEILWSYPSISFCNVNINNQIKSNCINHIILLGKYFIFKSKYQKTIPNFIDFKYYLKHNLNLEGLIAEIKGKTDAHQKQMEHLYYIMNIILTGVHNLRIAILLILSIKAIPVINRFKPPHTHTILLSIKLSILKIVNFIDS